jgi:branched-chain amino acid transport system ATP-binding protein
MLKIDNLHVSYGESAALFGVSLDIQDAEIVALLGRNGAGKTTLINSIMGLVKASQGSIMLDGQSLTGLSPEVIASAGVAFVPDNKRLFPSLTVRENFQVSSIGCGDKKLTYDFMLEYFPDIERFLDRRASTLSGGEQQMVTLVRSLMRRAPLVLLDEPTQGLAPLVMDALRRAILQLNKEDGTSFLLAEQNIHYATSLATKVYGLLVGRVCYQGTTEHFLSTKSYDQFIALGK